MKQVLLFFFWLTSLSAMAGNITVQNGNDNGPGSLRQAISNAKNGDVITFSKPTTVLLTSGQLVIDKNITVEGRGSTIRGSFAPLIKAEAGRMILLKNFIFWEDSPKPLGAILNLTTKLTLEGCSLVTNEETPGKKTQLTVKIKELKKTGLVYQTRRGTSIVPNVVTIVTDPGGSGGASCTSFPDRPSFQITSPFCGSTTVTVTVNQPIAPDIEYDILDSSTGVSTTFTDAIFSLTAGDIYYIFSKQNGCAQSGVRIDLTPAPPIATPVISVVSPACGAGNGSVLVTSPLGADYQYSNDGGITFQVSPTFIVAAGDPYGILVKRLSTDCVSTAATGVMAATPVGPIWYKDADNDGYSDGTTITQCTRPVNYKLPSELTATSGDCDDNDATVWQSATLYIDLDGDGYDNGHTTVCYGATVPLGYSLTTNGSDCNDNDASVHSKYPFYIDHDGDGYGTGSAVYLCTADASTPPAGYSTNNTDCNDNDATINPATIWYLDADNDGYNDPLYIALPSCTPPQDGRHYITSTKGDDCNDNDPTYNPETVWVQDADGDGYYTGTPYIGCLFIGATGYVRKTTQLPGDCDDNDASVWQSATLYIDMDEDGYDAGTATVCYGTTIPAGYSISTKGSDCNDNDATTHSPSVWVLDADNDNYYAGTPVTQCVSPGTGYVMLTTQVAGDCNDNDATINPGTIWVLDADNDGYYTGSPVTSCTSPGAGYVIKTTQQAGDCNDNDATVHAPVQYYIDGSTAVCVNTPSPNITFTALGGTAPYTFTYTLNNITQTVTTVSGNSITVAVPTAASGQFNYNLVSVQDNSSGTCSQPINNQVATVTVNPLPTANISGTTAVCKGGPAPTITFSGSGGTPPYTFTYTLPDGVTSSNVTGNPAAINVATGTPGAYTYTLTSVQDASTTGCPQLISGQSAIVTINPLPDPTITTGSPVTAASSGNIASVPDAGTGATYSWTISIGTISAGAGTRSITYTAGNSGSVQLNVSVTSGSNCGTATGSATVPITALPCPNPAVSVASSVCSSTTGNIASVASAGTGATYVWSITNGTITGGAGTRQISFTAASNKDAGYSDADYVKLSVKVTNASGGCTESSGIYKIFISPIPSATISTSTTVCSVSVNNYASVAFAGAGATYQWTITNGSITSGAATRSIRYSAGALGSVTLLVTVTNSKSCSASSGNKTIAIAALPVATITASASVCGGSGGNTASVANGASGTKYFWSITNGGINSGSNTSSISYTATKSGSVTLAVTVINSSGCSVASTQKTVTILAAPTASITASSPVCPSSTGNTASVTSAGTGATYSWTISNGTITSGSGTASIKYTAGTSGSVKLSVTVTNSAGCKASGTKSITISNGITPTFAAIASQCLNAKAPVLPVKSTNGISGTWSPSTTSTTATGTRTYTFTPTAGQCASSVLIKVTVTNCAIRKDVVADVVKVVTPDNGNEAAVTDQVSAAIYPNPSVNAFNLVLKSPTIQKVEIRVIDVMGHTLHHTTGDATGTYRFGSNFVKGVYFVEVLYKNGIKTLKVVRQ